MRSIIRVALVVALALSVVPQAAYGLVKPPALPHPDVAPVDTQPVPAYRGPQRGSTSIQGITLGGGGSSGTNSIAFSSLTDGDIVVVLDPASPTGHAGLFDRSHYWGILSYSVLSANITPVNGVQYEKCAKYRLYDRAYALRVPTEYSHRVAVRDFAARQLGKPYSLVTAKLDLSSFYCSKLAWTSYRYVAGVDLDADGGFWVWPVDLINSRLTTLVGYWG